MTNSNLFTTIENVLSLGGTLTGGSSGGLFDWGGAAKQADTFIAAINTAADAGNWAQVMQLSNDIITLKGLSQTSVDIAENIATAAQKASMGSVGLAPSMAALTQTMNAQLVRAQTAALHTQISSESSGILSSLTHASWLHTHGLVPAL